MKRLVLLGMFLLCCSSALSQNVRKAESYDTFCDSLDVFLTRITTVKSKVNLSRVLKRGNTLDFYFSQDFSDYPWHQDNVQWFRGFLDSEIKKMDPSYSLGEVFAKNINLKELITPSRGSDGRNSGYQGAVDDPGRDRAFIRREGERRYREGLDGRFISLWQSHGRYYDEESDSWLWQRAKVHRTCEDMFTQSFVLPFLIPMLENAGAYVMTPRERDTHRLEYIVDKDATFGTTREGFMRRSGSYSEQGSWTDAGEGFADTKEYYSITDNPFTSGRARQASCTSGKATATASWTADIEERGEYAVYISYKTLPSSSTEAHYTVHHLGGSTEFSVNQKRGGGTWIYLGSFEFGKGSAIVTLDNIGKKGETVSADAVKIGGGMGKIARGPENGEQHTSGMPSYMEGALYWMTWAGVGTEITQKWPKDYTNDYADRGPWTEMMRKDKDIPFDLSLAFHSDAGAARQDSIVGTLAIYTLLADRSRKLLNGGDRDACRLLAEYVQDQVCSDIRKDFNPEWNRRMLWNRSYSESRTSGVPAMILELLSHQNFEDMRYGQDPAFRFEVSRAVYKGILKFLADFYNTSYVVQPLPVHDFATSFTKDGKAHLSWEETPDGKEPTAGATGYIVYTRVDDGPFDNGRQTESNHIDLPVEPGHIYSYKVVAFNEGGRSFPSEILSLGKPSDVRSKPVLIVNNFTRVSAPYWYHSDNVAGFDARVDSGVPYINDISYIGENYENRRNLEWVSDDAPGFGATDDDRAGEIIAGNTFDYPYIHGSIMLSLGHPFCSMSASAFSSIYDKSDIAAEDMAPWVIDIICGKQVTTDVGKNVPTRYGVFPTGLQNAVRKATVQGSNIIISGAYIATDAWSSVYDLPSDEEYSSQAQEFCKSVLGYSWVTNRGTGSGRIAPAQEMGLTDTEEFFNSPNEQFYSVECPDGIKPADDNGSVLIRYDRTLTPAAVLFEGEGYKVASFGFPIEVLKSNEAREALISRTLELF